MTIVAVGLLALISLLSVREIVDFYRGVTRIWSFSNNKVVLEYQRSSDPRAFWLLNALKLALLGFCVFGSFKMLTQA